MQFAGNPAHSADSSPCRADGSISAGQPTQLNLNTSCSVMAAVIPMVSTEAQILVDRIKTATPAGKQSILVKEPLAADRDADRPANVASSDGITGSVRTTT